MTDNIFSLYEPSAQIWSSIETVNNAINRARFPDWFRVRLKSWHLRMNALEPGRAYIMISEADYLFAMVPRTNICCTGYPQHSWVGSCYLPRCVKRRRRKGRKLANFREICKTFWSVGFLKERERHSDHTWMIVSCNRASWDHRSALPLLSYISSCQLICPL
ncbi:hypothetical protein BJV77DRAFT_156491 [Russula vinacea]|nr:hypothetical protein BJV77DRAFT_156491 [Russula vinacea]